MKMNWVKESSWHFWAFTPRPELYELAGNCTIQTSQGSICIGAAPYGLALPSTLVDFIMEIDLTAIRSITFIEKKTNYDAYVMSEKCSRKSWWSIMADFSAPKRKD